MHWEENAWATEQEFLHRPELNKDFPNALLKFPSFNTPQNQGDVSQITRVLFYNKQGEPFQATDVAWIYAFTHLPFSFLSAVCPVGCF